MVRWRRLSLVAALSTVALMATVAPAAAHKFKLFATAQSDGVEGYAYFSAGDRAKGVDVVMLRADGSEVARATTDGEGRFHLPLRERQDYLLRSSVDGHRAEWWLRSSEQPPPVTTPNAGVASQAPLVASSAALEPMIEAAVARQVAPLRQQIDAYENTTRLHDVLGGLGWLVGLCGLYAWAHGRWSARRTPTQP